MKKITTALILLVCAAGFLVAQNEKDGLTLSGELKTGLFWYRLDREGRERVEEGFMHNSDAINQAGQETLEHLSSENGRFRLNFLYNHQNFGIKFRFETTNWVMGKSTANAIFWDYAFMYGYFFNDNLKLSAGKMGDSPWGAGGPDIWTELDTTMGMRFEFIPQFIPFIKPGSLNLGFVLNNFNGTAEDISQSGGKMTFASLLTETVLGFSYTHDFFHIRLSYRLDGLTDGGVREQFVYRAEERIIQKYLPGFQIIANGYWDGLNPRKLYKDDINPDDMNHHEAEVLTNYIYINYDSPLIFSPLDMSFRVYTRLGYESLQSIRAKVYVRPGAYLTFFNNLLQIGMAFEFAGDVGETKLDKNASYLHWYLEPEIRLNLGNSSYLSFVYRYYNDHEFLNPANMNETLNSKTHWINIRILFSF